MSLTKDLLVLTDHVPLADGSYELTAPSKQLLTLARSLTSGKILAIALNPAPQMSELGRYGADVVLVPDLADRSPRVPAVVADASAAALAGRDVAALLCVSNYRGREVAAQFAIRTGGGAAVDATAVEVNADGGLVATKSVFSGAWCTTFEPARPTAVIAVRPSVISAEALDEAKTPERIDLEVEFGPQARAINVRSSQRLASDGTGNLSDAQVVVCGGRGTDGDFSQLYRLAELLGGSVGATRVAADEGWVDRSLQIGQTGVTVAPKLYIGAGVSGAIHHTCGMQMSQHIVAICDSSDEPIFELADFGIVGDLHEVLPRLIEKLQEN